MNDAYQLMVIFGIRKPFLFKIQQYNFVACMEQWVDLYHVISQMPTNKGKLYMDTIYNNLNLISIDLF